MLWWAIQESNLWPRLRQRRALANWANRPICFYGEGEFYFVKFTITCGYSENMTSSYFVEILFDCEKENKFSFSNHHNISKLRLRLNFLVNLVSREGLEPSTPGLKGPCSNLLSYRPKITGHCCLDWLYHKKGVLYKFRDFGIRWNYWVARIRFYTSFEAR